MAMKLLGLGFSFSGKDKGAKKTAESLSESIGGIDKGIKSINTSARMNKLSAFIQSVSLHKLGQISDKLGDMASKAGSPELQTGLEKTFFQMNRTTSTTVAALGLSATAAKKAQKDWARWAYQMGVGVETVQEVGVASIQTGLDLKEYGMTVKDLVKLQEAYGVSGKELVGTFKQLETSYNITGKQAKSITDAVVAQGQAFGFGKEALTGFPEMTMRINKMFAQTFRKEGPEDFKKTALGITKLSSVMSKQLGVSFEQGRESAMAIFEQLSGAEVGFQKMAAGLESSMPGISEAMAGVGFDIGTIFDQIQQDPVEFAQSMRKSLKELRSMGGRESQMALMFTQRLHAVMGELPDEFRQLMDVTGGAGEKIDKMLASANSPVAKAEGALNRLAGAWKAPFDLDETLSRARERLATTLSGISKKETLQFVRTQRKAYDDIGSKINELAKDKGPLGFLIKRFSLFRKVGVAALFPMSDKGLGRHLGALAPLFTSVASKSLPFLTALGSLGLRPGQIVKPFTMLLKPLGIMYKMIPGIGKSFLRIFGPIGLIITLVGAFGEDLKKVFSNVWEKATKFVGTTLPTWIMKYIFGSKIDPNAPLWSQVGEKVMAGLEKAWEWTIENFTKGVKIFGRILFKAGDWLSKQPWDKYMGSVVSWLGDAFLAIGNTIWKIGVGIWDWIWGNDTKQVVNEKTGKMEQGAGSILRDGVVKMIDGLWTAIKKAISGIWGKITGFFTDETKSFSEKLGDIRKIVVGAFAAAFVLSPGFRRKIFGGIKNLFRGVNKQTAAGAQATCAQAAMAQQCMGMGAAGGAVPMAAGGAQMGLPLGRGAAMRNLGAGLAGAAQYGMATQMGPQIGPTRRFGRSMMAAPGRALGGVVGAAQWARAAPGQAWGGIKGGVQGAYARTRGALGGAWGAIRGAPGAISAKYQSLGGIRGLGSRAMSGLEGLSDKTIRAGEKGLKSLGRGFKSLGGRAKTTVGRMKGFGKVMGKGLGIGMVLGLMDPLVDKLAGTSKWGDRAKGAMSAFGMGMMIGGPIAGGLMAGATVVTDLAGALLSTKWNASNAATSMSELAKKTGVATTKMLDFNVEMQRRGILAEHAEKAGDWRSKVGGWFSEDFAKDLEKQGEDRVKALMDAYGKYSQRMAEAGEKFASGGLESWKMLKVKGYGAERLGSAAEAQEVMGIGLAYNIEKAMKDLAPAMKNIQRLQEMLSTSTGEAKEEVRRRLRQETYEFNLTHRRLKEHVGNVKKNYVGAWLKAADVVEPTMRHLTHWTETHMGKQVDATDKAADKMVRRSSLIEIGRGYDFIAQEAMRAKGAMESAGEAGVTSGSRVRARGLPATVGGATRTFGTAARGGETATLIQVLQAGFDAMVGAVRENTQTMNKATAVTLKVSNKGGSRDQEYSLAYQ